MEREPDDQSLREFLALWNAEMDDHFAEEERILSKYAKPDDTARLSREHMTIRQFATAAARGMLDLGDVMRLGGILRAHVRWEERHLFPAIEQSVTEADFADILAETSKLEARRRPSSAASLRGEFLSL